ncbi:TetR/AcrR family transcriptional regulator [Marseilla massiliensis]|jgi:TetR/AcrR family transcriptional regulator|nr:TetR/AcrR family transcriptional regulator [Marseilla massiliensis]MCL1609039.1 TetR/AcrR family transcriptional regulator [Marseilla massiliensis]MEE0363057.1 TetR/AcrR family transcriptional regulator [Prevotella sp.]
MATDKNHTGGLEARIVDAARQLFIERGFVGTSMSDIASRAGINRPTLHYYFRTKERMFDAVFGGIVGTLVPRVKDIVLQPDRPIGERVASVVDAYYDVFGANPGLPMFIVREMHRDFDGVVRTIMELRLGQYIESVRQGLQGEMDSGRLRQVPMRYLFLTFYSMLTMPFVAGNLCRTVLLDDGETFADLLAGWKPYIVDAMERLLDAGG